MKRRVYLEVCIDVDCEDEKDLQEVMSKLQGPDSPHVNVTSGRFRFKTTTKPIVLRMVTP